jgi:hypothetical protein
VGARLAWLRGRPAFARELNAVHESLFEALRALETNDTELGNRLLMYLEEVVVQVDDHLAPTAAQFVFLGTGQMPPDCQAWLEEWREGVFDSAEASGLALHALDFRPIDSVSVVEYRTMTRIW